MAGGSFFEFGGLVGGRDAIFFSIAGRVDRIHWHYIAVRFSPKVSYSVIIKAWEEGDASYLNKSSRVVGLFERLARFFIGETHHG